MDETLNHRTDFGVLPRVQIELDVTNHALRVTPFRIKFRSQVPPRTREYAKVWAWQAGCREVARITAGIESNNDLREVNALICCHPEAQFGQIDSDTEPHPYDASPSLPDFENLRDECLNGKVPFSLADARRKFASSCAVAAAIHA